MNDLERLWDDLPVGPAPVSDIIRAGRAGQAGRTARGRAFVRPLMRVAVLGGIAAAFLAGTLVDQPVTVTPPSGPGDERVVVTPGDAVTPAAFHGDLQPAASCAALRRSYVQRALELVGPYGWQLYYPQLGHGAMVLDRADAPIPSAGNLASYKANYRGPQTSHRLSSETGTNVQEAGVDEPDAVKTDGEVLLRLRHAVLTAYDVTGDEVAELGSLDLGDLRNGEILLAGDTVVAVGNPGRRLGATRVVTVDVTDPAAPALVETVDYDSALVTARQHGGDVRLVLQAGLPHLDFVEPAGRRAGPLRERLRDARAANRRVVRESTLADWIPRVVRGGGAAEQLVDCDHVAIPRADLALDTMAVVGFSADAPTELDALGLAGAAPLAYESPDHLYLATQGDPFGFRGLWGPGVPRTGVLDDGVTQVFDFALDGDGASYVGSGEVEGAVADRWSMDEHDGVLRLAVGPTSETGNFNSVVTLRAEGDELVEIGRLDRLGVGEQIQSVRWFQGLAILVTYRQRDPLYAVDLTDQTAPRLAGELKIPGFSEYLHPLGRYWMVGMGEGPGERPGWGAQVSLFRVGDLAHPRRLDVVEYAAGTEARAGDDPRQFTWLGQERTALTVISRGYSHRTGWVSVLSFDGGEITNRMVEVEHGQDVDVVRLVPLPDDRVALVTGEDVEFFDL